MQKTMKKCLSWMLALVMAVSMLAGISSTLAVQTYADDAVAVWDGSSDTSWYNTTDTVFTLTTGAQLSGLADIVNGKATGITADDFTGKTVKLGADIYLNSDTDKTAHEWPTIGERILVSGDGTAGSVYENSDWCGTFDGQGHYIYNVYTNHLTDQGEQMCLFSSNYGTIRNLGVTGDINSYRSAAGIVGKNYGIIEYCYTSGEMTANGGGGNGRGAAGIASENYGVIQYCWSDANCYNGYRAAGGITGYNCDDYGYSGRLIGCWFIGYADSSANECKGAIAGDSDVGATVEDCYFLKNSSGKIVKTSGDGSQYNGMSIGIGQYYSNSWDQTGTYEFDNTGALTSDNTKTVTGMLTSKSAAVVAGDSYYPVLYWQKNATVPSTVNITVTQPEIGGTVSVDCEAGEVAWGTNVTISYELTEGYKFISYLVNGAETSNNWVNVTKDTTISIVVEEIKGNALTLTGNDVINLKAYDSKGAEIKSGDKVPELDTVTVKAELVSGALPESYDFEYSGEVRFLLGETVKPSATGWATEFSFTMPGEEQEVSISAVREVRKEWIDLADTSWYDAEQSEFTITTPQQLAGIAKLVADGNNLYGKTFTLGNDIDLSNPDGTGSHRNWTPIGGKTTSFIKIPDGEITSTTTFASAKIRWGVSSIYYFDTDSQTYKTTSAYNADITDYYVQSAFAGTFDGAGHEITNLYINSDGYRALITRCGLFGEAVNATIKNLTVRGEILRSVNSGPTGGILGYMRGNLLIDNCKNYVTISAVGTQYIGGIAGGIQATNPSNIVISNCVNYADLSNNGSMGGIAGQFQTGSSGATRCRIEDCMNYGDLTSTTGGYTGGIAGNSTRSTVQRCGNEGNITGQTATNGLGGILGYTGTGSATLPNIVSACYNYGNVTCSGAGKVGGIVGSASGNTNMEFNYNAGVISSANDKTTGTQRGTGGLIGYSSSNSWNSNYNRGAVSDSVDQTVAGGFIGNNLNKSYVPYGYWLDTSCWNGFGYAKWTDASADANGNRGDLSNIISKTEEEMKSADFLEILGAATYDSETGTWSSTSGKYKAATTINDGFPILWWQDDAASFYITAAETENGTVTADVAVAKAGDTITVKAAADFSYKVKSVGYYTDDPETVTTLEAAEGVYTFTMPEANVTVVAEFEADPTVVVTVFGKDLTMADLLAHTTIKDYSAANGQNITVGIMLSDIFENYAAIPEGTTGILFNNPEEDDWLATRGFTVEEIGDYMLAWQEGTNSTLEDYKVRLIAPGYGKNNWMNGVRYITVCEHSFTDHKCTICGAIELGDIVYINGDTNTNIYPEYITQYADAEASVKKRGTNDVEAVYTSVTALLSGLEAKTDAACGYAFVGSGDFTAKIAASDLSNMYIYVDNDAYRSAWDGSAGKYWVSGLYKIEVINEHDYDENHICTLCGKEEDHITLVSGEDQIKVYDSALTALEVEETTKTRIKSGEEVEVTAKFISMVDVLEAAQITEAPECAYTFDSAGFAQNIPAAEAFIYKENGGWRSAQDGSAAKVWVSNVDTITLIPEHDYGEDFKCTACGQEEPSLPIISGEETVQGYDEVLDALATEETTKSFLRGTTLVPVTANFISMNDAVKAAGIETLPQCGYAFTSNGSYIQNIPAAEAYIYRTSNGNWRSAWDGAASKFWISNLSSVTLLTEHDYGEDHKCTVCGTEDTSLKIVNGEEEVLVYSKDLDALDIEESTKSYSGKNGTTEVTARFISMADVLNAAGIETKVNCAFNFSAEDGFNANIPADQAFIFRTEDGSWRSAWDGSAGRSWVSNLTVITLIPEHDYGTPVYEWAEDYSKVTAKVVCSTFEDHAVTEEVETIVETAAAGECDGFVNVYTAEFTNELFETQTLTVAESAEGHIAGPVEIENVIAATCESDGSYDNVVYCERCEIELSREHVTVEATGHTPAEAVRENEVPATCTAEGSYDEVVKCSVCGEELSREAKTIDKTEHTWDDGVVTEATWDAENKAVIKGYTTYTCTVCDTTNVVEFSNRYSHDDVIVVIIDGEEETEVARWTYIEPTGNGIGTYIDNATGEELSIVKDFTKAENQKGTLPDGTAYDFSAYGAIPYSGVQGALIPSRIRNGVTVRGILYEDLIDYAQTASGISNLRGKTEMGFYAGHDGHGDTFVYDEYYSLVRYYYPNFMATVNADPDAIDYSGGIVVPNSLAIVGYNSIDSIADQITMADSLNSLRNFVGLADGPKYGVSVSDQSNPNYRTMGARSTSSITKIIFAVHKHTPAEAVKENEVAATCSTEGSYDEVIYCSVCGEELSREAKTIEKIAHTPAEAVRENVVAATCSAEGSYDEVVKCSVCGEELSREAKTIEKIAHTPAEAVKENEVAATAEKEGSYDEVVYCSVCGEELSRETITIPMLKTGWQLEDDEWFYYDEDGNMVTGWLLDGDNWYYLQESGVMATGWLKDGDNWYYLKASGAMATGWLKDGDTWYYLKASGAMATGWVKDGDNWYYLKESGAMATGWVKDGDNWYYLKESGAMATGWVKDGDTWYYMKDSGAMATGWLQIGSTWYYLKDSGAMATGWLQIGNTWYYFQSNGAMVTGRVTIDGRVSNFSSSGAWQGYAG